MSVPVACFTHQAPISKAMVALLQPEYDLIHSCLTVEAALSELPSLCSGAPAAPSSGIGSNAERAGDALRTPALMFFSAGIAAADVEAVSAAVTAANPAVKLISVSAADMQKAGVTVPNAEVIAGVMKDKFAAALA